MAEDHFLNLDIEIMIERHHQKSENVRGESLSLKMDLAIVNTLTTA